MQFTKNSDGTVDIIAVQGKTWKLVLRYKTNDTPVDLTGWKIRGQIRKSYKAETVTAEWSINEDKSNRSEGLIYLVIPADITKSITCGTSPGDSASQYVYDIEAESPDGEITELLRGRIVVLPEVTRE